MGSGIRASYRLSDNRKVTLRALSALEMEELLINLTNPAKAGFEMAKRALVRIDGVDVTPDNRESIWASLRPKDASLIVEAFSRLHTPSEEERRDFFASEEIEVEV